MDEFLNAVLFVLIGLEVLIIRFTSPYLLAAAVIVPVVLIARLVSVAGPVLILRRFDSVPRYTIRLLTWGGLRGGISVALALSLPPMMEGEPVPEREVIIVLTYVVVAVSILLQGLTIGPLARQWLCRPTVGEK